MFRPVAKQGYFLISFAFSLLNGILFENACFSYKILL